MEDSAESDEDDMGAGIRMENLDFEDYGDEEDDGGDESGSIEDITGRIKNDEGSDDEMSLESEDDSE